jgi:hypothetical protein
VEGLGASIQKTPPSSSLGGAKLDDAGSNLAANMAPALAQSIACVVANSCPPTLSLIMSSMTMFVSCFLLGMENGEYYSPRCDFDISGEARQYPRKCNQRAKRFHSPISNFGSLAVHNIHDRREKNTTEELQGQSWPEYALHFDDGRAHSSQRKVWKSRSGDLPEDCRGRRRL